MSIVNYTSFDLTFFIFYLLLDNKIKIMIKLEEIELIETPQELYDSFNDFILSNDTKLFNKLLTRGLMYNKVKDIPGDIVECGVFKGSGFYTFLKLKRALNPNTSKKIMIYEY